MTLSRLGAKTTAQGTRQEDPVEDRKSIDLLEKITKEMKIFNLHMSVMTDNTFEHGDVE